MAFLFCPFPKGPKGRADRPSCRTRVLECSAEEGLRVGAESGRSWHREGSACISENGLTAARRLRRVRERVSSSRLQHVLLLVNSAKPGLSPTHREGRRAGLGASLRKAGAEFPAECPRTQ